MRVLVFLIALVAALSSGCSDHSAGSAGVAPANAGVCAGCHGPRGISAIDGYPHLAGQNREYLLQQMLAYRSGARPHAVMQRMVANLSDEELSALASYYAEMEDN